MSVKEEKIDRFINWGFRLAVPALCFILWQSIGDMNEDIKDVRTDIKYLIGEVSTLKGKMESYHK